MAETDIIPRVNEFDEVIGQTTIKEAKDNEWLRRLSRVFVFDQNKNILLQKRSKNMHGYPEMWDQAVGGHVDYGETYLEAARREMKEELGIESELTEITVSYWMDSDVSVGTFNGIYVTSIDHDTKIHFDPAEVETVQWFSIDEFNTAYRNKPSEFVPGFISVWKHFRVKLITS